MEDIVQVEVEALEIDLQTEDEGIRIPGKLLRSARVLSGTLSLGGDFQKSEISLPVSMAGRFAEVLAEIEGEPGADCRYFAHLMHGSHVDLEPDENAAKLWTFSEIEDQDGYVPEVGETIAYARALRVTQRTLELVRYEFVATHWAIGCGDGNVIQVMGMGSPVWITDVWAGLYYYDAERIVSASLIESGVNQEAQAPI